jgi:hypothetical protein
MHFINKYLGAFTYSRFQPDANVADLSLYSLLDSLYCGFNGGYYWGGALLIRPTQRGVETPLTVAEWNDEATWKIYYDGICQEVTFFAEDAFGVQFGVIRERIVQFDPETAAFIDVAGTLEEWCQVLVRDPSFYTGDTVLAAWERKNRRIKIGQRLIPKQPFVLGGEFHSDNMVCKSDVEGMRIRAQLWRLIRDLPDGQKIIFQIED